MTRSVAIRDRLLAFGKSIDRAELFPTAIPEAAPLIFHDPFAFLLACSLNRRTKAEIIWTIPYDLQQALGRLDPHALHGMPEENLDRTFRRLPHQPRKIDDAARTVKGLAGLVVNDFQGEAWKLWEGRTAGDLQQDLRTIYGVGPGIASMTAVLLERAYGVRFDDLDRREIDIKPDVHTTRVLQRLGTFVASGTPEVDATQAKAEARKLNPEYPGALDGPLWVVGRRWCHEPRPQCEACELAAVCERVGV